MSREHAGAGERNDAYRQSDTEYKNKIPCFEKCENEKNMELHIS
jgi:hypothetical protein